MGIETAIGLVVTALGTLAAGWLSYRAERRSKAAEIKSVEAEAIAKADKAKSEYVDMLERRINLMKVEAEEAKGEIAALKVRIGKLEAAEEICQTERQKLLALLGIQGKGLV